MEVRSQCSYVLNTTDTASLRGSIKTTEGLTALVFHQPKNTLIAGHSSGYLYFWRTDRGNATSGEKNSPQTQYDKLRDPALTHKGQITFMRIQAETNLLYTASADRTVKVLRSATHARRRPLARPTALTPPLRRRRRRSGTSSKRIGRRRACRRCRGTEGQ